MRHPAAEDGVDSFIYLDKLSVMSAKANNHVSPKGKRAIEGAQERARRGEVYQEARDEYAAIRALR